MTTTTDNSDQTAESTHGPVTVRRATPGDAHDLQKMLVELAVHEGDGQHVHVDVAQWTHMLADPRVVVLLAEGSEGQLGYVSAVHQLNLWIGGDILALDDLYVRAGARSRGVGEQLMTTLAAHAATDALLIRWEMKADNDGAQRFYRRLGATLRTKVIAAWRPDQYAERILP
jgi:ribosomal protein S18 acetylase RimI-like enzyme